MPTLTVVGYTWRVNNATLLDMPTRTPTDAALQNAIQGVADAWARKVALTDAADTRRLNAIAKARAAGLSWRVIAERMGRWESNVLKKYGDQVKAMTKQRATAVTPDKAEALLQEVADAHTHAQDIASGVHPDAVAAEARLVEAIAAARNADCTWKAIAEPMDSWDTAVIAKYARLLEVTPARISPPAKLPPTPAPAVVQTAAERAMSRASSASAKRVLAVARREAKRGVVTRKQIKDAMPEATNTQVSQALMVLTSAKALTSEGNRTGIYHIVPGWKPLKG
jgi:hypothetical protein